MTTKKINKPKPIAEAAQTLPKNSTKFIPTVPPYSKPTEKSLTR